MKIHHKAAFVPYTVIMNSTDTAIEGTAPPPFEIMHAARLRVPFVYNAPHSGSYYPPDLLKRNRLSRTALRSSEDSFSDLLFADAPELGANLIRANYARAYVDTNRDATELDPRMFSGRLTVPANPNSDRVKAGLGVIPSVVAAGQMIYGARLPASEAAERLHNIYFPHHEALRQLLDDSFNHYGCVVLVDCHSMPSGIVCGPRTAHQSSDIVIGDAHGRACAPVITATAVSCLKDLGYRVAVNMPYAGGYNTRHYGRPYQFRHAIQIEINRALYMDERRYEPNGGYDQVKRDMRMLMESLHRIPAEDLRRSGTRQPVRNYPQAAE